MYDVGTLSAWDYVVLSVCLLIPSVIGIYYDGWETGH